MMMHIWLVGALLILARDTLRQIRFQARLLRNTAPATGELLAEALVVADALRLKRKFSLRIAQDNCGPLLSGLFHPIIVAPANFDTAYTSAERQLALAHELAHIARGDLIATLAALFFRAAQWPNPLVHYAFSMFREDQEASCDASVLSRHRSSPDAAHAYAAVIVKSAGSAASAPAASLSIAHHLKERLAIMKSNTAKNSKLGRALAVCFVAAGLAASASYTYAASNNETDRTKEEKQIVNTKTEIIEADGKDKLVIPGVKGAVKIEVTTKNGPRTVRVFDKKGNLLTEKKYGPDEPMEFDSITLKSSDGRERVVRLGDPITADAMWIENESAESGDRKKVKKTVVVSGDDKDNPAELTAELCNDTGSGESHVFVFSERNDDRAEKSAEKRVVCLRGVDSADPAKRADALRKAIESMEASAKAEAEHRQEILAKLREELAKAEAEAKKKK
ncbi:MAG: hypothetical protein GC153_12655 [Alphaproteobacteria bacterium]|nr:hypothetical protein [Alphaproteobacteria bacterium]